MIRQLTGRARRLGDDVNTDYIISSTRKRDSIDERILARYLFETLDPAFAASVQPGDILVAGRNFGCGSAMEVAVTVILAVGIRAVVAESFARTFYRNAINNGLLPVDCATTGIAERDEIIVRLSDDVADVVHSPSGTVIRARPIPPFMLEILERGGLVPYVRGRSRGLDPRD